MALSYLLALVAALAAPQVPLDPATLLRGYVIREADGRAIGHVPVIATRIDRPGAAIRRTWSVLSEDYGYFQFSVPPGRYRLTVDLPSEQKATFRSHEQTVDVNPHYLTTIILRIKLQLKDPETVSVDQPPNLALFMLPNSSLGGTFRRDAIESAPGTHGRNVQSLLAQIPGVVFTDSIGTLAQFTSSGQRRFANRMTIDGASADLALNPIDPAGPATSGALPAFATSGGTQTLVSYDAIDEISVTTSASDTNVARTPGAQTVIVTKSGSDRFSATASSILRPNAFSASNWFSNAGRSPQRDGSVLTAATASGGPIVPKHLFYFATWEHQRLARPVTTAIDVPSLAARETAPASIRPLLDAFPQPTSNDADIDGFSRFRYRFPSDSSLSAISTRLDATLPRSQRLFARFNYGRSGGDALSLGQVSMPLPVRSYTRRENATIGTLTAGWNASPTTTSFNEFRINGSLHSATVDDTPAIFGNAQALPVADLVPSPPDQTWLGLSIAGNGSFVANGRLGNGLRHRQFEVSDTLTIARGAHQIRLGFDYALVRTSSTPTSHSYTYAFDSLDDLLHQNLLFGQLVRAQPFSVYRVAFASFAQDTIRLSPRLTVGAGIRHDVRPSPATSSSVTPLLVRPETLPLVNFAPPRVGLWQTSRLNVAPRFSAAYQFSAVEGREASISGAWGLSFDDPIPPGASPFGSGYPFLTARGLSTLPGTDALAADDAAPQPLSRQDQSTYFAIPDRLKMPRVYQWHIGLDQSLPGRNRVAIAYAGSRGRDLIYSSQYMVRSGGPFIKEYSNAAHASYHAELLEYALRPSSHGFQVRAMYAWSHSLDNQSAEEATTATPPRDLIPPDLNYGSSDFDRRHVFQAVMSYRLPSPRLARPLTAVLTDWQLDAVVHLRSGTRFNVQAARSLGNATWIVRPDVVPDVPVWIADPAVAGGRRVNPDAYFNTRDPRQGTAERNGLTSTPLRQVDVTLSRTIRIFDKASVQFRIECFNLFNTPNFGRPYSVLGPPTIFGRPLASYADAMGTGTLLNGGLPSFQQLGGPRAIQIALRFAM